MLDPEVDDFLSPDPQDVSMNALHDSPRQVGAFVSIRYL